MDLHNSVWIWLLVLKFSTATQECHTETGRCYWLSTSGDADWETARSNCQSQGGDLAVIETVELYDFVYGKFR